MPLMRNYSCFHHLNLICPDPPLAVLAAERQVWVENGCPGGQKMGLCCRKMPISYLFPDGGPFKGMVAERREWCLTKVGSGERLPMVCL